MALGCVFHFNVTEAMLLQKEERKGMMGTLKGRRIFQQLRILKMTLPRLS